MAGSAKAKRNATLDYLRLIAAFAIVWGHAQAPGSRIAYLALPFFLVLLGMPTSASLPKRVWRLLRPFLIWSLIYALMRMVMAYRHGAPLLSWWQWEMTLIGTSIHLWFLPFAIMGACAFRFVKSDLLAMGLPVVAAALVVMVHPVHHEPFAQWVFGIVPLTLGFCLFRVGLKVVLPWLLACAILFAFRTHPDNLTVALGSALSILAVQLPLPASNFSAFCTRISLLIFLCHMLVMQAGWTLGLAGLELGIFAVIGALAMALVLDRLRGLWGFRWLA